VAAQHKRGDVEATRRSVSKEAWRVRLTLITREQWTSTEVS